MCGKKISWNRLEAGELEFKISGRKGVRKVVVWKRGYLVEVNITERKGSNSVWEEN